jgi:hypothetical protein
METGLTVQDMNALAKQVVQGKLFPSFDSEAKLMTLMMLCQAEGIPPIVAVRRYDIIQGRPALKSDAMLGDFQTRGGKVAWLTYTEEEVKAEFSAPGLSQPVIVSWTIEMANRAGLTAKTGPWKQYPRAMLKSRVISEGIRISMPAIISGIYTPEEVADFVPQIAPQAERSAIEAEVVPPQDPKASKEAVKALAIAMGEAGIKDKEDVLNWCYCQTGHKISSRNELTATECSRCIDAAKSIIDSDKVQK